MAKREDEIVDSLAGDEGGAVGHWPGVSFRNGAGEEIRWDQPRVTLYLLSLSARRFYLRLHPSNRLTMLVIVGICELFFPLPSLDFLFLFPLPLYIHRKIN